MPAPDRQREFALQIAKKLRAAGYEALWAGGCVRDELLGLSPKDYDVATNATPDQIRELFGRRRTLPIGASFGVITVLGPRDAGQIEVATFRSDSAYSDGRHPDHVTFTTAEHDAQRRDFTINGLFFDPLSEQVVDYVAGQADLKRRTIRAIGDPRQRLNEDRLRMLRAIRFATTFDFTIEAETLRAIQEMAGQINSVSAERIGAEIRRMLLDPNRARALELLRHSGLLEHVLPEVAALTADDFNETTRALAALPDPTFATAMAVLLHRLPDSNNRDTITHLPPSTSSSLAPCASRLAASICRRLRFTNKETERTTWILSNDEHIARAVKLPWPKLQRILTHAGADELLAFHEAVTTADDESLAFCRERLAWPAEQLNPLPLVDGSDLIRHGLKPSPQFSELLEKVRDAQLNGELHTRDEALAFIDRWLASEKIKQ